MKIIGLTGNSGSGKTSISKILAKHGAYIIDTDKMNHELMSPNGNSYDEILEYFGKDILKFDKTIDRKILGEIIFSDKEKRLKLEKICHKHVFDETCVIIDKIKTSNTYKYIVVDAPLLLEAGMKTIVDMVWLVYADEKTRLNRILSRDAIDAEKILARFKAQTNFEEHRKMADVLICNDNISLEELEIMILSILKKY